MYWILLLIILGLLLYFAELVLLPGITVAAVGSFCCLVTAASLAFVWGSTLQGFLVLGAIVLLVVIMTVIFLRPKTWKKAALHTNITQSISDSIDSKLVMGQQGRALTRLAPMGKVVIEGLTVEAKTTGGYLDEGSAVKIIGFDNDNIIVELV